MNWMNQAGNSRLNSSRKLNPEEVGCQHLKSSDTRIQWYLSRIVFVSENNHCSTFVSVGRNELEAVSD